MPEKKFRLVAFEGIDGAGKSTLLGKVTEQLQVNFSALSTMLARQMVGAFKNLVDVPAGERGRYQDVIPKDVRHISYIVEAIVQFELLMSTYNQFDYVLFDRWLQTNTAYLGEISVHSEWFKKLMAFIPEADKVYYVRIDPEIAVERLAKCNDWLYLKLGEKKLLSYLKSLTNNYESIMDNPQVTILHGELSTAELVDLVVADLTDIRSFQKTRR